jgi:hypothetical protein
MRLGNLSRPLAPLQKSVSTIRAGATIQRPGLDRAPCALTFILPRVRNDTPNQSQLG